MKNRIVPVKNIATLSKASRALLQRAPGAPGIGLVEGVAGAGKSTAIAWLSNQTPSIYVRAMALWTPSAMLGAICRELRLATGGSCAQQVERIIESLSKGQQTVFIDEVDYIVRNTRLVETLRDLHDLAVVPVILIGETGVVEQLSHLRRFTSRIAEHVSFEPVDLADATLVAEQLCEVGIKSDLIAKIHSDTRGNLRNIVVSLAQAEQQARSRGLATIGVAEIGRKALFVAGGVGGVPA